MQLGYGMPALARRPARHGRPVHLRGLGQVYVASIVGTWENAAGQAVTITPTTVTIAGKASDGYSFLGQTITLSAWGPAGPISGTVSSDGNTISWPTMGDTWTRVQQSLSNPYPAGVSVNGTGPNGSATLWRTAYYPTLGLWVADSGFGIAPIYRTAADLGPVTDATHLIPYRGQSGLSIYGIPAVSSRVLEGFVVRNPPPAPYAGMDLVILTSDGGQQYVWYRQDIATGLWVPDHARGTSAPGGLSLFDDLLIAGAIIAAAVVTYGAASGWFAGAAADTGAAAGSASAAAAAAPAVNAAAVSSSAIGSSTLGTVFSISKYIQTLAGAYTTVANLAGGNATHPQAGTVIPLPNGGINTINPNGSSTITLPTGQQTTIGAGGVITQGGYQQSLQPGLAGFGGIGGLLLLSAVGGYLLTS